MGSPGQQSLINILYIDDEPALLDICKIYLEKDGDLSVDTLTSAVEALESHDTWHYDAVVSDYQMPDMDGIAFLKQLKVLGDTTPFIIFTGKGREDVVIEALNSGADFYLQKGGDPKSQFAELSNKIRYAVNRKRAEKSLENTVKNLIMSQQVAHVGNWTFDIKNQVFQGSEEASRLFGYPPGYCPSYQEIAAQIYPEDRPRLREAFKRLIETGEPYTVDMRIYRHDTSEMRFIHSKGQMLSVENGEPVSVFGIDMDITDRKRIEEELLRKNEELNNSFEKIAAAGGEISSNPDELIQQEIELRENEDHFWKVSGDSTKHPIFIMDPEQRIIHCNSVTGEIFGIKKNEVPGKYCWEVVHGTSGPIPGCPFMRMRETLSREVLEINSNDRIQVVTVDPMLNDRGELIGAVHNIRDITEFRVTEKALQENEEKFRDLFNKATDAIVIHDKYGRFLEVNDTICERLGYSREELTDMTPFDIDAPECAGAVPDLIERVLNEGLLTFETVHLTKDGKRIPVEVSSRPIRYHGETVIISTGRDLSWRKQAEEALRQANRKLNILSSITRHDIKNSIMVALGYLDLASDSEHAVQEEYIGKIHDIIMKINRQIEFTGLYENLGSKEPIWQNHIKIIRKLDMPEQVSVRMDGLNEEIFADMMLRKVFENLLEDSLAHGEHVTEINITSRRSGSRLIIAWEDNGLGIPTEEKEKIFEHGFGKNSGLGLFLSREILSITGIGIRETGEAGKGARFEMTVPDGGYRDIRG